MTNINPNSRAAFVELGQGRLTKYGQDVIADLYRTLEISGSGDSIIETLSSRGSPPIMKKVDLEQKNFISVSSNYTTSASSFLKVTSSCTITLNSTPSDGEKVTVYNTNRSRITIDGGSRNISGQDKIITVRKGTILTMVYYLESDEWILGL